MFLSRGGLIHSLPSCTTDGHVMFYLRAALENVIENPPKSRNYIYTNEAIKVLRFPLTRYVDWVNLELIFESLRW